MPEIKEVKTCIGVDEERCGNCQYLKDGSECLLFFKNKLLKGYYGYIDDPCKGVLRCQECLDGEIK